jgi:hypothetical protein
MRDIAEFLEDHEDEVVAEALKKHYDLCKMTEANQEMLDAIALVLKDFMPPSDYLKWIREIAK